MLERGAAAVTPGALPVTGELDWATSVEGATRLRDLLYRRAGAAYYEVDQRDALVGDLARGMGERLGWDAATVENEAAGARAQMQRDLDFGDDS